MRKNQVIWLVNVAVAAAVGAGVGTVLYFGGGRASDSPAFEIWDIKADGKSESCEICIKPVSKVECQPYDYVGYALVYAINSEDEMPAVVDELFKHSQFKGVPCCENHTVLLGRGASETEGKPQSDEGRTGMRGIKGLRESVPESVRLSVYSEIEVSDAVKAMAQLWTYQGGRWSPASEVFEKTIPADTARPATKKAEVSLVDVKEADDEVSRFELETFINCLDISPDGRFCFCGGGSYRRRAGTFIPMNCELFLWNLSDCNQLRWFEGHTDLIRSVSFSADGRRAASASADKTVRLWNVRTAEQLHRLDGHTETVNCVRFSPDRKAILSAGDDGSVRLWSVETGQQLRVFTGHRGRVFAAAFSPDGKLGISGGADGIIRLWDLDRGQQLDSIRSRGGAVFSLAVSADGQFVLSGGPGQGLSLWDLASRRLVRRFLGHTGWIQSIEFSPDGRYVVSASGHNDGTKRVDCSVRLWEVETGRQLWQSGEFEDHVDCVAFCPDSRGVLSCSGRFVSLCRIPVLGP